MNRDEIIAGLDRAATSFAELRERRLARDEAATYPGGRGLGANRTPQERKVAEREAEQTFEQRTQGALDAQADIIAEDGANIIKQQNASDALSKWVQECSDGISNLGRRVAQLEDWKARAIAAAPQLGQRSIQLEGEDG